MFFKPGVLAVRLFPTLSSLNINRLIKIIPEARRPIPTFHQQIRSPHQVLMDQTALINHRGSMLHGQQGFLKCRLYPKILQVHDLLIAERSNIIPFSL